LDGFRVVFLFGLLVFRGLFSGSGSLVGFSFGLVFLLDWIWSFGLSFGLVGFSFGSIGSLPFLIQICKGLGATGNFFDKGLKPSDKGNISPTKDGENRRSLKAMGFYI
jgi:hypothetical protein